MNKADRERKEKTKGELLRLIVHMGYPAAFAEMIAQGLQSERGMARMIGYLKGARPESAEEIADEMLAIQADRDAWIRKKSSEYYNSRLNIYMNEGLDPDADPDNDED
ncbi:MAG: hypothetical protein PUB39_03735 [Eubacteriales bacterium]|nr:hypothetical protein [Eubacteriales bacterium]